MIYLFGIEDQVSVIMHERFLTEEQRAKATLVLETLPEPEEREGYRHIYKSSYRYSVKGQIRRAARDETVASYSTRQKIPRSKPRIYVFPLAGRDPQRG